MSTPLLLTQIVSSIRAGILAVDTDRTVVFMNPAARALLSVPDTARPEGQPIETTFAHSPQFLAFLTKTLRAGAPLDREEIRLAGVTGAPAMILGITVTPLTRPDGTIGGAVALFKDLTQIERGEEQAALKERLAALGQMAAGLAHEMRNPLASIKVIVGLLQKAYPNDPDLDRKLRSIFTEVQRLNQTVTDCLAFARPIGFEPRCVRIEDIIGKILNQVISLEHTYPFSVVRRFNPTPEAWLDPQQMEIVFFNIINNAIDAMRQRHGTITITTDTEQSGNPHLVVTVSDTGEGIPSDRIPMLFTPFFTTKGKGSGLGLANAKKIIDHLQGKIHVTTAMGVGTTFIVRVPLTKPMKLAS